jgi:hypothetical protein
MGAVSGLTNPDQEPTLGQQGLDYERSSMDLTNQETGCKWTGQPRCQYLCITECHVCRVWKCWIHLRTERGVTVGRVQGLIEDVAAYLELTGPKGTWRVVDETAGEIALHPTDHVVILSIGTLTKWMDERRLVDKTTLYSPNNTKCVIFHNRRTTDASEESLLYSALEADNSNFGGWLCLVFRHRVLKGDESGLTNSISTGTWRTHNQGMIVLMERVNASRYLVTEAYSQRRHCQRKPEILLVEDVHYTQVPGVGLGIVQVF